MSDKPDSVLFICTANYYRSRLAEEVFNHAAARAGLSIRADSAGFMADHYRGSSFNPGVISRHTAQALRRFGIEPLAAQRSPRQFRHEDLTPNMIAIALSRTEHYTMAKRLFPLSADKLTYWEIEDIEFELPESATERIREMALKLVSSFS